MVTDEELINDFAAKVSKGEITFDKIRPQLEQQGFEEARIKQIVRRVDDEVQTALVANSAATSPERVIQIGTALTIIGGVIILGSATRLFSTDSQFLNAFAYGSLVAGIVMIVAGVRRKNNKNTGSGSDTGKRTFRVRKTD